MIKNIIIQYILSFFHFSCLAFTIVIDPGHGGGDKGATQGILQESQIALKIGLKLANLLEKEFDTKVIMTRSEDQSVSLKNRVQTTEFHQADLFISLHGNSSFDTRAKGAEFFIANSHQNSSISYQNQPIDFLVSELKHKGRLYQSQQLATETYSIWKRDSDTFGAIAPRSIKQAPFFVINKNKIPSILVEFGFITNPHESRELIKDEKQSQIATHLYSAIQEYRQSLKLNK